MRMMPDQIEQTPDTLAAPDRASARDLQRAALRDLVALASECTRTEAQIEQKHRTELEAAEETRDKTLFVTEQRAEHLKDQIRQKYQEQVEQIAIKFGQEMEQLTAQDAGMRQRIDTDWEKAEKELRDKLQQSTWLADSVLE